MPKPSLGRAIEATGLVACLGGLGLAFALTVGEGPIARQISNTFLWLTGTTDAGFTATLTGVTCLLPGLGLLVLGSRLAGPAALSPQIIADLMARRRPSPARRLAVLVCLSIAALGLVALASLWPEIAVQME